MSKDLIKKILEASNHIHRASNKGSGNFIVTSPQVAKLFQHFQHKFERIEKCNRILNKIKNEQTN